MSHGTPTDSKRLLSSVDLQTPSAKFSVFSRLCGIDQTAEMVNSTLQRGGNRKRLPSTAILAALLLLTWLSCGLRLSSESASHAQTSTAENFHNPILWEDLADIDILRVGDTYYYSASNMHYSPGAPILRSYDLVNWEYAGHSVPVLDFGPQYNLMGGNAYVRGTWASFLGYRKSNKTFYWGGCIDFSKTYLYTAPAVEGPWKKSAVLDHCYYDAGLLIDDDDKMYVAYGNTTLNVAQLSPDGSKQVKSQPVFTTPPDVKTLEGSRFYKVNGNYYIFTTRPPNGEYVLKSTTGPFGPYTMQKLVLDAVSPVASGGAPHQGGIVDTPDGHWYYMGFVDAFPGGRIPVLAPLEWGADGWPKLQISGNTWGASYPYPVAQHKLKPRTGVDTFQGATLGPEWEWNHNPDNTRWSLDHGLKLQTATVTDDLYMARNTLTRRIPGPQSTATIELDDTGMKDGDRAGLAMFRDSSAWVGIKRDGDSLQVAMETGLEMSKQRKSNSAAPGSLPAPDWGTIDKGAQVESFPVSGHKIWLRISADIRPGANRQARFFYSTDGSVFKPIGKPFVLKNDWQFFMGYRFALFNYATHSLGGAVRVSSFTLTEP